MPFVSDAQRKFMFARHPAMAKEFAAATPKGKKLPEHVESREHHMKPPKAKPAKVPRGKSASAPGQLKKAQGLQNASSIAKAKAPERPSKPSVAPSRPAPKGGSSIVFAPKRPGVDLRSLTKLPPAR